MGHRRPTLSVVPVERVEFAKRRLLDLRRQIRVAEYVVPCDTQLLRALHLVSEKHHCGPLDIVVVFEVQLKLHLPDFVFFGDDPVVQAHRLHELVRQV